MAKSFPLSNQMRRSRSFLLPADDDAAAETWAMSAFELQRYISSVVLENLCLIDERAVLALQEAFTNSEDEAMHLEVPRSEKDAPLRAKRSPVCPEVEEQHDYIIGHDGLAMQYAPVSPTYSTESQLTKHWVWDIAINPLPIDGTRESATTKAWQRNGQHPKKTPAKISDEWSETANPAFHSTAFTVITAYPSAHSEDGTPRLRPELSRIASPL